MEEIVVKNRKFVIESEKAIHEDHVTYIAIHNGVKYLIRSYKEGYEAALADYKILKKAGISMSKLCFHDDENKVLVLDYFPEEDVLTSLSKGDLTEEHYKAFYRLYRFARFSKIALDWQPQNFMLRGSEMFYLPIKVSKLTEENTFENAGITLWFRGKDCIALLKKKGFDVSSIKPLEEAELKKKAVLTTIQNY